MPPRGGQAPRVRTGPQKICGTVKMLSTGYPQPDKDFGLPEIERRLTASARRVLAFLLNSFFSNSLSSYPSLLGFSTPYPGQAHPLIHHTMI